MKPLTNVSEIKKQIDSWLSELEYEYRQIHPNSDTTLIDRVSNMGQQKALLRLKARIAGKE